MDSKVLNGKNVISRSYRKKTAKEGDKRRTSVIVEETAASQAFEFLDGGGGGRSASTAADSGSLAKAPSAWPAKTPSAAVARGASSASARSATPAPASSASPVHFTVNATTGGPPRPTVNQYRYAETRRPATTAPGEHPRPQFTRPLPPHPLCPVHSPLLAVGSPPFSTKWHRTSTRNVVFAYSRCTLGHQHRGKLRHCGTRRRCNHRREAHSHLLACRKALQPQALAHLLTHLATVHGVHWMQALHSSCPRLPIKVALNVAFSSSHRMAVSE
ncbi:hypothetical protein MTO96_000364 [Rhipicephalus appendiculatus]